MVNSEQFSERLQKILDYYDLSAAAFADAIEVGRSSISHIISGRNKPSLDFVLKIVQAFPEVELYWLLNGKGDFPSSPKGKGEQGNNPNQAPEEEKRQEQGSPVKIPATGQGAPLMPPRKASEGKRIRRIVLFYDDGTFEAFEN